MKILIIHSFNIPLSIRNAKGKSGIEYRTFPVSQASVSQESYDTFLLRQVKEYVSSGTPGEQPFCPDLIVLPFSLSSNNPSELTGLRLAAHIRLEEKETVLKRIPMLFLGPVHLEEALRLAPEGSFLLSPRVYYSNLSTAEELEDWIDKYKAKLQPLSETEYASFLKKFIVETPSNYEDSNHSITNRWNLLRWQEMFAWGENVPKLHESVQDFADSLYFRWLQASLGNRSHFKQKNKAPALIPNIADKKVVFIDDEIQLGWGEIMSRLFINSKASFIPFTGFDSSISRNESIDKIKRFVDDNPDGDCYLLDLRLHEEDHTNPDHTSFTGHRIAQYIYEKNHGSQIVFFTASEKAVNYVESEKYFSGYVIKENPEHLFDRDESKRVFDLFARAIQKACNKSYLKEYYEFCKDTSYLNDFFEIMRQDDESNSRLHDISMRSAALNLIVYIESSIKDRFRMDGYKIVRVPDGQFEGDASKVFIRSQLTLVGKKATPVEMTVSDYHPTPREDWKQITSSDLFLICATLSQVYGIPIEHINKVIELKNIRNQSIAHGNGPQKIDVSLLITVFEKIARIVLAKTKS